MTDKERYADLKARGICVYCKTAPAEDGKITCRMCREKQRRQTAEKRKALKQLGFCIECGRNRIFGSESICPECVAKKYENNRKHRKGSQDSQYFRERRERLKASGICVKCGKRMAESNKTRCCICNIRERDRARRYRGNNIPRSERPSYGMCYFCGAKIESGSVCEKCSTKITQNLPKDHKQNEYWKQSEYARIAEIINRKEKKASGSDFNV